MSGIVWQDPPAPKTSGRLEPIRDALKAKPGKWALIYSGAHSSNSSANLLRKEGFEITIRTVNHPDGTKTYDTYARWPKQ